MKKASYVTLNISLRDHSLHNINTEGGTRLSCWSRKGREKREEIWLLKQKKFSTRRRPAVFREVFVNVKQVVWERSSRSRSRVDPATPLTTRSCVRGGGGSVYFHCNLPKLFIFPIIDHAMGGRLSAHRCERTYLHTRSVAFQESGWAVSASLSSISQIARTYKVNH